MTKKKYCLNFITLVVSFTFGPRITVATFSALSRLFILTFPSPQDSVHNLHVFTYEVVAFKVTLSASRLPEGIFDIDSLTVSRDNLAVYHIELSRFTPQITESNRRKCITLHAGKDFGFYVYIFKQGSYSASFLALPVSLWGKRYFAVTLQVNPFIIIMSEQDRTLVKIKFHFEPRAGVSFEHNRERFYHQSTLREPLKAYEAFIISFCNTFKNLSLTGTVIQGTYPIGVISGSCFSHMPDMTCKHHGKLQKTDLAMEMVFPQYMYGFDFVAIFLPRRTTREVFVAISSQPRTTIRISNKKFQVVLERAGQVAYINSEGYVKTRLSSASGRRVTSDKRILLAVVAASTCEDYEVVEFGGPSITMLLSAELFSYSYYWRDPMINNTENFLIIVASSKILPTIMLNNEKLSKRAFFKEIAVDSEYLEQHYSLKVGENVFLTSEQRFGCYVCGLGASMYLSPAGLTYEQPIQEECVESDPRRSDDVDNDCDGDVDEEMLNLMDDDGDGRCDEDYGITAIPATHRWGVNCSRDCSKCQGGCSPIDGYCDYCTSGFKGHNSGCQIKCDKHEYGENCEGDCYSKCQSDCSNSVTGECSIESQIKMGAVYIVGAVVFILFFSIMVLGISKKAYGSSLAEDSEKQSKDLESTTTNSLIAGTNIDKKRAAMLSEKSEETRSSPTMK